MPVLADEAVDSLLGNDGVDYLDCTFGAGGHSLELIAKANRAVNVYAFDIDPEAVRQGRADFGETKFLRIEQGSYGSLSQVVNKFGLKTFDGILADFGQSSDQISNELSGMSYQRDTVLDMRYNRETGMTAEEYLNNVSFENLKRSLKDVGQESEASKIAKAIIRSRPLKSTGELEKVIRSVTNPRQHNKILSRCFMVIRVTVNDELGAIDRFMQDAISYLKVGGIWSCISFDSNQDGRVKRAFQSYANPCTCPPSLPVCVCGRKPTLKLLSRRAIKPSEDEIARNPRSRSARLRVAERI